MTQRSVKELPRDWEPPWDSDFRSVENDVVGNIKMRADQAERHSGIDNHKFGIGGLHERVHSFHHWWVRQ